MSDNNRDPRKRFNRGGRKDRPDTREDIKLKLPELPAVSCPLCQRQIFDVSSALADPNSGEPVHFDCALTKLAEMERLGPNEHIAYIGRGSFAVVEYRDRSQTLFTIKRKLQYEKEGAKYDWRLTMQKRMGI